MQQPIPPHPQKEWVSERTLQKGVLIAQIISMLAIPIVVAFVGFFIQKAVQGETIKRDYVRLAVTLLAPKKKEEPEISSELKQWAIRLLNESSPVPLAASEIQSIKANGIPFAFETFGGNSGSMDPQVQKNLESLDSALKYLEKSKKTPPISNEK